MNALHAIVHVYSISLQTDMAPTFTTHIYWNLNRVVDCCKFIRFIKYFCKTFLKYAKCCVLFVEMVIWISIFYSYFQKCGMMLWRYKKCHYFGGFADAIHNETCSVFDNPDFLHSLWLAMILKSSLQRLPFSFLMSGGNWSILYLTVSQSSWFFLSWVLSWFSHKCEWWDLTLRFLC